MCILTISFKHEYRRHTLTSGYDLIGHVIIMKNILVDDLHTIFLYLLSNWGYFRNFKNFSKLTKILGRGELFRYKCHRKLGILSR